MEVLYELRKCMQRVGDLVVERNDRVDAMELLEMITLDMPSHRGQNLTPV